MVDVLQELMQKYRNQLPSIIQNRMQRCEDCICLNEDWTCDELQKYCYEIQNCPEISK